MTKIDDLIDAGDMTPDYKETMPREIFVEATVTSRGYFCVERWSKIGFETHPLSQCSRAKYTRSDLSPAAINREMLSVLKIMRRHVGSTCDYLHVKNDLDAADAAISKAEQAGDGTPVPPPPQALKEKEK